MQFKPLKVRSIVEKEKSKIVGIVGGMGPQAGIAVYENLIKHTRASVDQEHLSTILVSFPEKIVDRTLYLEGKTSINPAYEIVNLIRKLSHSGARVIGIACNTSHAPAIFDVINNELKKIRSKPMLLNMPLEVCNHIFDCHPGIRRIGLMTTNGTYRSGLYKKMLEDRGYEVVVPGMRFQNAVIHRMIYDAKIGIKANSNSITSKARSLCAMATSFFRKNKADAIILGCTELSLILNCREVYGMQIIDSAECLAKALIREARTGKNGMTKIL